MVIGHYSAPMECPGLSDSWGSEFNSLYDKYVSEGRSRQTIKARELWSAILTSQIEVGILIYCIKMLVIVNQISKI